MQFKIKTWQYHSVPLLNILLKKCSRVILKKRSKHVYVMMFCSHNILVILSLFFFMNNTRVCKKYFSSKNVTRLKVTNKHVLGDKNVHTCTFKCKLKTWPYLLIHMPVLFFRSSSSGGIQLRVIYPVYRHDHSPPHDRDPLPSTRPLPVWRQIPHRVGP